MLESIIRGFFITIYGLVMFLLGKYRPDMYYWAIFQIGIMAFLLCIWILMFDR